MTERRLQLTPVAGTIILRELRLPVGFDKSRITLGQSSIKAAAASDANGTVLSFATALSIDSRHPLEVQL